MKPMLTLPLLATFLAACHANLPTADPIPSPTASLYGRIAPRTPMPDHVSFGVIEGLPQDRVPVQVDGTFSLPLPVYTVGSNETLGGADCTGSVTDSNPAARFEEMNGVKLRLWKDGQYYAFAQNSRNDGGNVTQYLYVFSSAATTIRGVQACPVRSGSTETFTESFNVALEAGWNVVKNVVGTGGTVRYENAELGPVIWR